MYRQANGVCTARLLAGSRNDEVHWKHGSIRWCQGLLISSACCDLGRQAFAVAVNMRLFNLQEIRTVLVFPKEMASLGFQCF